MDIVLILLFVLLVAGAGYAIVTGMRRVPGGSVGIVTKRLGMYRRPDDDPQVSIYGAAGVQARAVKPNELRWLPGLLYDVRHVPLTNVPNGTIGLVVAKAGAVRPPGRPLARHVECHYFQDGEAFLKGGGEQGRQQQVLTSGNYAINTALFDVVTVNDPEAMRREGLSPADLQVIEIPIGETGVVITHVGETADRHPASVGRPVPGHFNFQLPWVFIDNGGQMGVQEQALDEGGHYVINPWFARIVRIPTRILILDWTKDEKAESNLDASLKQIVLDVQGHTVRLEMTQTVRIPVEAAPRLVRRFGTYGNSGGAAKRNPVQQFVEKELGATVTGYFRKISSKYRIQEFITNYDDVCNALAREVRQALEPTGVIAVTTTLEEFECDEPAINELRRRIALQQEQVKLEQARHPELEARRVSEDILSEIEHKRIDLERERKRLELLELETLIDRLGAEYVQMERLLERWVRANVPQWIGGDGNIAEALLQAMPFAQARDMLMGMAGRKAVTNGRDNQDGETPTAPL